MSQSGRVRIIGGMWRSRMIEVPPFEGVRPTTDRVRETLFNWLGQAMHGKSCLDLFAGSGALGFEALSRGAASVVMVDNNDAVTKSLRQTARGFGVSNIDIYCADAMTFLDMDHRLYDVIFLDPPFRTRKLPQLLAKLSGRLTIDGVIYVESDTNIEIGAGWQVWRTSHAGNVQYQLLKRKL